VSTGKPREQPDDDAASFSVDFASGHRYDMNAVRRNKAAFMPDGEHSWVIGAVYGIDDPDQAMDSMSLGPENFVGVTPIHCLLCTVNYTPTIRHYKCSQKLVSEAERAAT
jgi:hypothetical protein